MSTDRDNKELNDLLAHTIRPLSVSKKRKNRFVNEPIEEVCEVPGVSDNFGGYIQWTTHDGINFFPASETKRLLYPGVYEIQHSNTRGIYFSKIPVKTDGLIRFPQTNVEKVVKEIELFWDKEDIFSDFGLTYKRGIILWGPPGCHAKGTRIIMYDGSLKKVEDVKVGDFLVGPDSKPRSVLELVRGRDLMYKIYSNKEVPFVVNQNHILNLERSSECKDYDKILNISVADYLKLSNTAQKCFKLRKGLVENKKVFEIDKIENVGKGEYYGFILSGDHLYLTEDFVVHHNSGKSCCIQLVVKDVIERGGVVVKFGAPGLFSEGIRIFRKIQEYTPAVILMEDIDSILEIYNESEVLNILDGIDMIQKVIFLATTNYPQNLGARIINRPSRFDKRFKIGFPNKESRKLYFEHLIGDRNAKDLGIDVAKWVEDTRKFSIAHLKELFVAVVILGDDYKESINTLKSMAEDISSDDDEDRYMGFLGGDDHEEDD